MKQTDSEKVSRLYRILRRLVLFFYSGRKVVGTEQLPADAAIVVGNHAQLHGPLISELYFPGDHSTWCAGQMMHLKEVPAYAFQDFWSQKPRFSRWFYRIVSYLIAPLAVFIFNNARTIGVYHDIRIMTTFRQTLKRLSEGANVVIFPEHDVKNNHIVYEFQDKFIDIARLYRQKTGKELQFVPMYVAPKLKTAYLGKPIAFCSENDHDTERRRICDYLTAQITEIACGLPRHTVVPYRNIPKKYYPSNIPEEVSRNEKAGR